MNQILQLSKELFIAKLFVFAIVYALLEVIIYKRGFRSKHTLFSHFGIYHLILLLLFITVSLPKVQFIPLMLLTEDMFYFLFDADKKLNKDSWVNFHLGGFNLLGQWIPNSYLLAVVIYIFLEILI